MRERLQERRAVRVRIHEVIVYVEELNSIPELDEEVRHLDLEEKYLLKADTNTFPTTEVEYAVLPLDIHSLNSHMMTESKEANIPELKKMLLTNMLLASSGNADPAATLHDVDKGPFPPKSYFLTVTVNKSVDDMRILYRIDIPLTEAKEFVFNEETANKMFVIDRVHALFEGAPALYEHVTKVKLYAPQPYLVFPACTPGVVITMILSRVTEWPRAYYICDHSYEADHALMWRQVTCMSHGMIPNEVPPLPTTMRRLRMHVSKRYNDKANKAGRDNARQAKLLNKVIKHMHKLSHTVATEALESSEEYDSDGDADSVVSTESIESLRSVSSVHSSVSSVSSTSFPSIGKKTPLPITNYRRKQVINYARVLWTLLPTPNAGVVVGFMHFYAHSSPSSSSIKYWCVVIDKCLLVYKNRADTKPPRESVNLRICTCVLTNKDMIRIHRPSDKQVWYCMGASAHRRHDWVAWIVAACGNDSDKV